MAGGSALAFSTCVGVRWLPNLRLLLLWRCCFELQWW